MFLWGKSINGTQQLGPASSDLDLDFTDDVFENLDAAFTIHFEAHKNDLTLFVDYQYAVLDPSTENPIGLTADVELDQPWLMRLKTGWILWSGASFQDMAKRHMMTIAKYPHFKLGKGTP